MWTKRYKSKPGSAKEGYYFSIRLVDGTWINLQRNPFKIIGDEKPDFIEFEPEKNQTKHNTF